MAHQPKYKAKYKEWWGHVFTAVTGFVLFAALSISSASAQHFKAAWPDTDFSQTLVDLSEIQSGGPPKDGIPSIDRPQFTPIAGADPGLSDREPVIAVKIDGKARAYPIRYLMYHEIVNDKFDEVPVAITFCPLCNSALVFNRRIDGKELMFGTTGLLRNSDLVMYDRTSESWWQQYSGESIVGHYAGTRLTMLPSTTLPFELFKARYPDGQVLSEPMNFLRPYGRNPYGGYDTSARPFLFAGHFDEGAEGISPMARVVAIEGEAWSFPLIETMGEIETDEFIIRTAGQMNSALDQSDIAQGRLIAAIEVVRKDNPDQPVVHDTPFAFAFRAFNPDGILHTDSSSL